MPPAPVFELLDYVEPSPTPWNVQDMFPLQELQTPTPVIVVEYANNSCGPCLVFMMCAVTLVYLFTRRSSQAIVMQADCVPVQQASKV